MKTYIFDTNPLIRHFTQDIKEQAEKVNVLLRKIEDGDAYGEISITVIQEVVWILENKYNLKRTDFVKEIIKLFAIKNIDVVETSKRILLDTLLLFEKSKFDFVDLYLFVISKDDEIFTFDKDFKKIAKLV